MTESPLLSELTEASSGKFFVLLGTCADSPMKCLLSRHLWLVYLYANI